MATTRPVEGPLPPHSEASTEILTPPSSSSSVQGPEMVAAAPEELPTESHQLAHATEGENIEEVGLAQLNHGQAEVKDLGWNEEPSKVAQPLVGGLPNEELWTLIRRFNKQMYHVKSLQEPPLGGLDLNIADEEEFSPDKLRANIERLYMTVIVGLVGFYQHIARLRSWRERNRTLAFAGVYLVAWVLDFLVPTIITFLIVLIVYRPSRPYCFPPAPLALIDTSTGGVKKPTAGVLGSDNSLTGAPEKHKGEAVEQEASNFFNSFTSIAISSAAGKHPDGDPPHDNDARGLVAPDPSKLGHGISDAKEKSTGGKPDAVNDKTKEPMSQAMWSKTRPVMHAIADIADTWERFGNVLHATSPFPHKRPRLKLAGCLVPVLLISMFTTSYMFTKINGLVIGFGFFADPLIWRGLDLLNRKIPNWQKYLELRNSILKGIPTNAQLTITLLRIGEVNKAPLPPPPYSGPPPPMEAHENAGKDLDHLDIEGVSDAELADAIHPDAETIANADAAGEKPKKKKGHHFMAAIKSATKGGVESLLGADRLKAAAGREHAQNRLGVLKKGPSDPDAGPIDFPCRFKGKRGHAYITSNATSPAVSWTTNSENIDPVWSVAIADIQELKKVGGLGWKSKLIVGWATSREIADGLLIIDKMGNQKQLTAIALREELFNRLISMGTQMWESW